MLFVLINQRLGQNGLTVPNFGVVPNQFKNEVKFANQLLSYVKLLPLLGSSTITVYSILLYNNYVQRLHLYVY